MVLLRARHVSRDYVFESADSCCSRVWHPFCPDYFIHLGQHSGQQSCRSRCEVYQRFLQVGGVCLPRQHQTVPQACCKSSVAQIMSTMHSRPLEGQCHRVSCQCFHLLSSPQWDSASKIHCFGSTALSCVLIIYSVSCVESLYRYCKCIV